MSCTRLILLVSALALSACASNRPIIYPNAHSQAVGGAQVERDIAACKALAESAGTSSSSTKANTMAKRTIKGGGVGAATGAVGGAIAGHAGRGAAIGAASGATAGLIHSLFGDSSPNPTYRNFVTRCMNDRGYDLAGWD
ncbi:MAG: outer membrane lipoprotein SlyB [Gammaproteobacteria bacterium]|jgi:outer membrane lipoprotein SlyB